MPTVPFFIIPRRRPVLVVASAGAGLAVLLWLGMEDTSLLPVTGLAAGVTLLVGLNILAARHGGRQMITRRAVIGAGIALGAGWGAGTALTAAGIMLLKTALHSHAHPDFGWPLLLAMFARAPGWGLAGALFGLGAALLRIAATFTNPPR